MKRISFTADTSNVIYRYAKWIHIRPGFNAAHTSISSYSVSQMKLRLQGIVVDHT